MLSTKVQGAHGNLVQNPDIHGIMSTLGLKMSVSVFFWWLAKTLVKFIGLAFTAWIYKELTMGMCSVKPSEKRLKNRVQKYFMAKLLKNSLFECIDPLVNLSIEYLAT